MGLGVSCRKLVAIFAYLYRNKSCMMVINNASKLEQEIKWDDRWVAPQFCRVAIPTTHSLAAEISY